MNLDSLKLNLPFAYNIVATMRVCNEVLTIVSRNDKHHPFVVYKVAPTQTGGAHDCYDGYYEKRLSSAFETFSRLIDRRLGDDYVPTPAHALCGE